MPQPYVQGPVVINGGTTIKAINDKSEDFGQEAMTAFASHRPYPSFVAIKSAEPTVPIKTTDLKSLLASVNLLSGRKIEPASFVDSFLVAVEDGGVRLTGTVHHRTRINKGLWYIKTLSGSRNEPVTADTEICVTYDGTNPPFILADNVALPANPYVIEQYTVGKVVIGGVTLDDVQSLQIDLNPEVKKLGGSDDVYPTCSYLQRINPRFTLTVLDARRSTAYGLRGSIITDATIYLRRMRNGSDRFADADAVHMKWELAGSNLMAWPTQTSGPEAAESATTLQLQPIETSAQPLWTFSVDVPVT